MRHYPIFLDLDRKPVIFSGAGETAAAKIALLLKTDADIRVFGSDVSKRVADWAQAGRITLVQRSVETDDLGDAALVYGANGDEAEDARVAGLARAAGALSNTVDDLEASDFLTPAIVDRSPVTVAIGTEGTAPVLARRIKAQIEEMLPTRLGELARIADRFRPIAARHGSSARRRAFWARFFGGAGEKALEQGGEGAVGELLRDLLARMQSEAAKAGSVSFVGSGPGDPDLLTLKARKRLHEADVVLYDRLATPEILELARREAIMISVGKKGYGSSWIQDDINALLIDHAEKGHRIVRLKSGDPAVFGRLDEEIEALEARGIDYDIVPGITAASAAAASMARSLTRRSRNASLRIITGRDMEDFAEQDWQGLASRGATAAIYMAVRAATFVSGRLLMHGTDPATPVTVVENASRSDEKIIASTVGSLVGDLKAGGITGPAVLMLGLAPRAGLAALDEPTAQRTGTEG